MTSPTTIVNRGLALIGEPAIESYSTSTSANAKAARVHYDAIVAGAYEAHPWHWAERKTALVATTSDDESWTYAYVKPGGMKRLIRLEPENARWSPVSHSYAYNTGLYGTYYPQFGAARPSWMIRGATIYAQDAELYAVYIVEANEADWPQFFQDLISAQLALDIVMMRDKPTSLVDRAYALRDDAWQRATALDSRAISYAPESNWLNARI